MDRSRSTYGEQPRSLNINWMKHDVTDPNVQPEPAQSPRRLSALQVHLQERANEVRAKRMSLTGAKIESKIDQARVRRDLSAQEHVQTRALRRVTQEEQKRDRHAYLSQLARVRLESEETKVAEATESLRRIREESVNSSVVRSSIAEADEHSEMNDEERQAVQGMQALHQMNVDLESLIRHVFIKMQAEQRQQQ